MGIVRLILTPSPSPYTTIKMLRAILVLCLVFYITLVLSAPNTLQDGEDVNMDSDAEIERDPRTICFCRDTAQNKTCLKWGFAALFGGCNAGCNCFSGFF